MRYEYTPNGTSVTVHVTGYNEEELRGELLSLQNKGVAIRTVPMPDGSFVFCTHKRRLQRAFELQGLYTLWNSEKAVRRYKGKNGGFLKLAKRFAREKWRKMAVMSGMVTNQPKEYRVAL